MSYLPSILSAVAATIAAALAAVTFSFLGDVSIAGGCVKRSSVHTSLSTLVRVWMGAGNMPDLRSAGAGEKVIESCVGASTRRMFTRTRLARDCG